MGGGASTTLTPSQGYMIFPTGAHPYMMKQYMKTIDTALFKNYGHKIFKLENDGRGNSEIKLQMIPTNLIPVDSIIIDPKNQHDTSESFSLQKIMSWESYVPQFNTPYDLLVSTIPTTACAITLSTKRSLAHNNFSSLRTQSTVHIPNYGTKRPSTTIEWPIIINRVPTYNK